MEAIAEARRLLRTFASAPDARRQARSIHAELARPESWSPLDRREIDALGAWLRGSPPISELRARCEAVVRRLAGRPQPAR